MQTKSILKASDFKDFNYSVLLSNTTANTDVLDSARIRILELSDRGMILKMPKGICAAGHMLMVFVFPGKPEVRMPMSPANKEVDGMFAITAKVSEVTQDGERYIRVNVDFYQFRQNEWEEFVDCFKNKQERVNKIINTIQGRSS